jgi:hypothetical protein
MRAFLGLALVAAVLPLQSASAERARGLEYEEEVTGDGYWKIEARSRRGEDSLAIDVALYRAAELARAAGHRFVEMHDAHSRRDRVSESAVLYARGVDVPAHPAACRSGRARRCYTADVAAVLRQLSGASGNEPGVPVPTTDEYGRTVLQSGFGIGAVSAQ